MARTGITYQEVADAATQLVGIGRNPTVEQIRLALGTGSSTTIANHLRQWRANQESSALTPLKENMPAEMVSMLKGLWERLVNHSEAKINAIQNDTQQTIEQLQQEVEKYRTNNQRWQKMYAAWQQEKTQLTNDLLTIQQALEFAHKEAAASRATEEGLHRQLQEKQDRIDELHRLHKQMQSNLEHYRESAREQRMLDQEKFEREKHQLQLELKRTNELLMVEKNKHDVLKSEHHQLIIKYDDLQSSQQGLQVKYDQLNERILIIEHEKSKYYHESQRWESQHHDLQSDYKQVIEKFTQLQSETHARDAKYKHTISLLEEQNKLLVRDKNVLEHEKSELVAKVF